MTRILTYAVSAVFLFFIVICSTFGVSAQATGTITGRVLDGTTGNALPGVNIIVEGTSLSTETEPTGAFSLVRVPAGPRKLTASYLGFKSLTVDVNVTSGRSATTVEIELSAGIRETVTVEAPFLEGQARALNQQKESVNIQSIVSSDQIGRFPDPNSAEAAQRIPGITIERDQGEGRYVQVRGTEARLNSMQINGERIPSPEGDVRAVALDVIPADLLDSIEVSKALTADQDADSIGGAVNLVTKGAPEKTRVSLTFGLGYNRLVNNGLETFNGTFGRRFADKKLGFLFSGSYLNTRRGSESVEPAYDEGFLEEIELRDYQVNRRRWGINPYVDYRFSFSSEIYFRGIFNDFKDDEFRRLVAYKVADNEIARELRDRLETQRIYQFSGGGRHLLGRSILMDYRISYGYAEEDEPKNISSAFLQEDVDFEPNVTPGSIDPENIQANPLNENINEFAFDELTSGDNFTSESSFTAQVNFAVPLRTSNNFAGTFKFGAKNRFNRKERDNEEFEFGFDDDIFLTDILDPKFNKSSYRGGLYNFIPAFQDPQRIAALRTSPGAESEKLFEEDSADYDARENIFAFYAMAQLGFGERFVLVPGIRYEQTDVRYTGFRVLFDDEGDYDSTNPIDGDNTFRNWFPSLHAKYRIGDNTNIRAAYSRSLARPNFVDLVPFQLILREDSEIERGNPFLRPTTSDNLDFLVEHYFQNVGVISGGFFFKRLKNSIFPFRFEEDIAFGGKPTTFEVTEPRNGESANLYGFEIAYNQRFTFMPKPFDGLGVYANYTYVNSDAVLPNEDIGEPGRDSILPGQAKNIANFALFYERFGFSGRGSLHYRDKYLSEVAGSPEFDLFVGNHLQFDFSASQRITKNVRVFFEFININNRPFKSYEGVSNRIRQDERYKWWSTFGVKVDW